MSFETVLGIMSLAGTGLQAVSTIQQAQAQAGAARYSAAVAEQNAATAEAQAAAEAERLRRRAARERGRLRAGLGASGLAIEGSPLELLADHAAEGALEEAVTRHSGAMRARELRSRATLSRFDAADGLRQSYYRAGTSLLLDLPPVLRRTRQLAGWP